MTFLLSVVVAFNSLFASPYFTPLRDDLSVPSECQDLKLSHFDLPIQKFFVGRSGAKSMGFTFEYPVKRDNARLLWRYFRSLTLGEQNNEILNKIHSSKELTRDYITILRNYKEMDFNFETEGEILEILAIEQLYQEFPENAYFITGGVEYHEEYSPKTIGELDIFVGRRSDCTSVAVGEAKLGTHKMLQKARKQISRFSNFLRSHNKQPISKEYKPKFAD